MRFLAVISASVVRDSDRFIGMTIENISEIEYSEYLNSYLRASNA